MSEVQVADLGSLLAEIRTGPFGTMLHKRDYVDGGVPVVNPQHFRDGRIRPARAAAVSDATATRLAAFKLSVGDVVVARRGEMGRTAVVGEREVGWLLGTGSVALKPVEGLSRS